MSNKTSGVKWLDAPEDQDFPNAVSFLSLILAPGAVDRIVDALKSATTTQFASKDILRTSRLERLGPDDPHVAGDLAKIRHGKALSPILLVRGDATRDLPLVVADGFHRVCAVYHEEPNTPVPCRIVALD